MKDLNYVTDESKPVQLGTPKWVKASKERLYEILTIVIEAKNNKLKTSVDKEKIYTRSCRKLTKRSNKWEAKVKEDTARLLMMWINT